MAPTTVQTNEPLVDEVSPFESEEKRAAASRMVDLVRQGKVVVVLRWLGEDHREHLLDPETLRGLLLVASAQARGERVSVVSHGSLLSPQAAAQILGVSRPMVYRFIERGDLPAIRVGTHWRIRSGDVLHLLNRREELKRQVDEGFTAVAHASGTDREPSDAKAAWRESTEEEREQAWEIVRSTEAKP